MLLTNAQAAQKLCPIFRGGCKGNGCMGWIVVDIGVEMVKTISGASPKGDGWKQGPTRDGITSWQKKIAVDQLRGRCNFMQAHNDINRFDDTSYYRTLPLEECDVPDGFKMTQRKQQRTIGGSL